MRKTIGFILLVALPLCSFGQDFFIEFKECFQTADTVCQLEVLNKWEKATPNDAELFTSFFQYHFSKSKMEVVVLSQDIPAGESLELRDSTNDIAGFMGSQIMFEPKEVSLGIEKINVGIEKFPDRLDMRFGKTYVLGQVENWEEFTKEIIKAVNYSAINNNNWTWTNNEKSEDGKKMFLTALQDYQLNLYDQNKDDLLLNMREIANSVLTHYPNHIESLSNLSITYLLLGKFDEALVPLLKAEKINGEDHVVLLNIAYCYRSSGKLEQALAYYQKAVQHGDEASAKFAQEQIVLTKEEIAKKN